MLIDYLTFSFHRTELSSQDFHIEDVAKILYLSDLLPDFYCSDIGRARFYDHAYSYRGITIYTTNYERGLSSTSDSFLKYCNQGISFEFKGDGCSFVEHRKDELSGSLFSWRNLFNFLVCLSRFYHYKINVSRLDFAFDEITYINQDQIPRFTLDDVAGASLSSTDERSATVCVSSVRSKRVISEETKIKRYNSYLDSFENVPATGCTVYFGSRDSNFFCRFYDKFVENHLDHADDPIYLRDTLGKIATWTRFEAVFKNEVAVSIMLAMVDLDDEAFSAFLAKTLNSYIRFCVNDDSNLSRCTVCVWWADFMLSAEHSRIELHEITKNEFNRAVKWISKQVATTAAAIIANQSVDFLIQLILDSAAPFSSKHQRIADCDDYTEPLYLSYEELQALKPVNL